MQNLLCFSFLLLILLSCNSDDTDPEFEFEFEVIYPETVEIDKDFEIEVQANQTFRSFIVRYDYDYPENAIPIDRGVDVNGQSGSTFYQIPYTGEQKLTIEVDKSGDPTVYKKDIFIDFIQSDFVKIKSIQVNDFYRKGSTWDDEYDEEDENRLADLKAVLAKHSTSNSDYEGDFDFFYHTETYENESAYRWNLNSKDLYIRPDWNLQFALVDMDGSFIEDLLAGPPFEREIDLSDYQQQNISIVDPEYNIDIEIELEWP